TVTAIGFFTGPGGSVPNADKQPVLDKPVSCELGYVSPESLVLGSWRERDIAYHAEHIATMLTNNAGFNCNATRVIIQHAGWNQREQLLQQIRGVLAQVPPRNSYYPGAKERHSSFVAEHPDAEQFGSATADQLPWTLITGVDPKNEDDICFTTEAFCGLFAETTIEAADAAEYLDRAVDFANEHIWGTLNATILVHPASLKDPSVAAALDRAVANLRYGSIGVNYWGGTSYALVVTTWGAFPGHTIDNIQSGTGVVHNTLLFDRPQKTVLRAPFIGVPTPPWFATRGKTARKLFPKLVDFEAAPSPWKIPGILWTAVTG